jgi:hypothetical protein
MKAELHELLDRCAKRATVRSGSSPLARGREPEHFVALVVRQKVGLLTVNLLSGKPAKRRW